MYKCAISSTRHARAWICQPPQLSKSTGNRLAAEWERGVVGVDPAMPWVAVNTVCQVKDGVEVEAEGGAAEASVAGEKTWTGSSSRGVS